MNSKKAITLLVLATLILTLVPLTTTQAITITDVYDEVNGAPGVPTYAGVYDDTLIVVGSGVTAGKNVRVYWDAVDDWDGEAGLLNSTKAKSSGAFELWFDIPEAVNGDHYLWLQDVNTGDTIVFGFAIDVDAYVEADPDAGLDGDTITLNGFGYDDEVDIETVTISSTTLLVPIVDAPLSTSPGTPETDTVGSWSATFKVPDFDDGYEYDDYLITVTDDATIPNSAIADFTIGPALTLDIEEGTVGAVVEASGRGFNPSGLITAIYIEDSALNTWTVYEVDDDMDISSTGKFNKEFVIPSVDDVDDDYEIVVVDNAATPNEGRVDFEVLGHPGVETDPEYAVQGSTVAVMGYNFTNIDDEEVVLYMVPTTGAYPGDAVEVDTLETDNDGELSGTFKVPAVASGTYEIYAVQDDWGIINDQDLNSFKVGLMIVILSPDDGPTGEVISVTASGFEGSGSFEFNISDIEIMSGTVDPDGSISESFVCPILDPGTYMVSVLDGDNDITVTAEFEVTDRASVETTPTVAPNEYNVTIEGWFFSQDPSLESLDFLLFNETEEWDLDVDYGGVTVELGIGTDDDDWDDGYFSGWFLVPDDDVLSIGTYTLNVTDEADLWAQYTFEVVDKTVEIESRKATFRLGDTVSFDVISTFILDMSYVEIMTPDGDLYWKTDTFDMDDWVKVGTEQLYPYFAQIADGNLMTLLDDAPLGEWSWVWYDEDDDELDSGVFTVEESAAAALGEQITDLNNQITDLQSSVSDVSSEFESVKSDIADVAAIAQQAVSAANQAKDAVQTVAETANQANTAAENAAEAANAAKDAANGLTTLVYGAIGAALVAALAAIVSLMQISRRIAG
jgi:hypothetical protein